METRIIELNAQIGEKEEKLRIAINQQNKELISKLSIEVLDDIEYMYNLLELV